MNKKRILAGVAALMLSVTSLSGCGDKTKKEEGTPVISWYLSGVKQNSTYDDVWNKANELLEEKYGLKLDMVLTDGDNFAQKIQMMNAAQEEYDLVFTSNWLNTYYSNVANGSLLKLNELLPEYAPKLNASLTDAALAASTVNGGLYAVPNWQVQARSMGFLIPKDLLDSVGMTIDEMNTMDDFENYLTKIVEKDANMNKVTGDWNYAMVNYGMVMVSPQGIPGVIYYNKTGKPQIVNQYETPEFMEFAQLMRDWNKKGLLPAVHNSEKDYFYKETRQAPGGFVNWKPGCEPSWTQKYGYEFVSKQISPAVSATASVQGTMTGVGANSTHPEDAVKMLEIIHTDKEIYNLLAWGLEGVDYEKVGENTIKKIEGSTYSLADWSLGSVANSYILEGNPETVWEDTKEYNDNAVVSPLMGFVLDTEPITAELGNCETVVKEYLDSIQYGLSEPTETIPKLIDSLKVAGVDKIMTEIQGQIDKWWDENK